MVGCFLDLVGDVWSRLWRIGKAEANRSSQKAKCNVRIDRREIRAASVLFFFNLAGLWRMGRRKFLLWMGAFGIWWRQRLWEF